ncbi:DUF1330 domain-containing protein [Aquicoccus sp. G2-2]|uniref:DUF1330 domain-containing protein n=1 Tax=Aquicoccus sp. G2-2 TaxID=3092120 RepID=UPI002AE0651B|nr:DUF1330 domain-containing protein [Aquicoccus sp. G2-2]MEA1113463.1 DUF1330 domain-containing protein [Aquicoccus sp. G2-2]
MDYQGFTGEEFRAFRDVPRDGPIHMLNLVLLRENAEYPDGRVATGAEAYAAYGRETAHILEGLGGRIVWRGKMEAMLIGPQVGEGWDLCFIAEYPNVEAFVSMIKNPDYRVAMVHRQAAVKTSRLIRMEPLGAGEDFGG